MLSDLSKEERERMYEEARQELIREGKISSHCFGMTADEFWQDRIPKITQRAQEILEKKEYERLKKKYG